jgi:hypothetical protein
MKLSEICLAFGRYYVFTVRAGTVTALFQAQRRDLQGVLRLDISARKFPPDPGIPCAWTEAQEAVAERLLRLLAGYADEQVLDWDADHAPEKFKVVTDQDHFVPELTRDLDRIYGLDPEQPNYEAALKALASDLFHWASASSPAAWEQDHLIVDGREMYVEGRPYPALAGVKQTAKLLSDWDSSELRRRLYNR